MIQELQDLINIADASHNEKAKKILLKVAEAPESSQHDLLTLVKIMIQPDKAGEELDKWDREQRLRNGRT